MADLVNIPRCPRRSDIYSNITISTGIGLSYALLAKSKGARAVLIADVSLTDEADYAIKNNALIEFIQCDVTKWGDLQNIIDVSSKRFGDFPDVYVASAGVFEPVRPHVKRIQFVYVSDYLAHTFSLSRISGKIQSRLRATVINMLTSTSITQ